MSEPRLHFWPAVDGQWIAKATRDGVYVRVPGTLREPRLPGVLVWRRLMHSLDIAVRAKERHAREKVSVCAGS